MNFFKHYKIVKYIQPKKVSLKNLMPYDVIYSNFTGDFDISTNLVVLNYEITKGKRNDVKLTVVTPNGNITTFTSYYYNNDEPEYMVIGKCEIKKKESSDELTK